MLINCRINHAKAERELTEYKAWIDGRPNFLEREVVDFLKTRLDLCLLIQLAVGRGSPDRHKHEFGIQGVFRADFVVGCSTRAHFVLVEFEGGEANSLFKRGTNQMRDWGNQLQHGLGQISDWTWAKNDNQHTTTYQNLFGLTQFSETYLIICGRDGHLSATEKSRLSWRHTKTLIAASPVYFWTYDDFYIQASAALDVWRDINTNFP